MANSTESDEQKPVLIVIVDEPTTPPRTSEEEELDAERTMLSSLHRYSDSIITFVPVVAPDPPKISLDFQSDDDHRWSGRTSFPDLLKLNSKPLLPG